MADIQTLVDRFHELAVRTNTAPTTLSRKVFGGGHRIRQIEAGSPVLSSTYEQAMARLEEIARGITA